MLTAGLDRNALRWASVAETGGRAWALLERDLDRAKLAALTTVAPMADLPRLADEIVAGKTRGRTVIEIS